MLKVKSLKKYYQSERVSRALNGISFSIDTGEHLFVIGETGSGKTTLLNCIYGNEHADSGQIIWQDVELGGPQLIPGYAGMKLVKQDFDLKMFNTVNLVLEKNLPIGLTSKQKNKKLKQMLELFSLERSRSKQVLELSGGQQQRLALACAMLELPELLLLDEPFAHFDPELKGRLFEHIRQQLKENHALAITVTHDYTETLKHADKVLVLRKGKVVQYGDPQTLYRSPKDVYTAGLLGEFNLLDLGNEQYYFRPSDVTVGAGNLPAVITDNLFCGHYKELVLDVDGQTIVAHAEVHDDYKTGQSIKCDFPRDAVVNNQGKINWS